MINFAALGKLFITFLRSPICVFISVKGVVIDDGNVWLRLNEHNLWELPGGRMEPHEQPAQTVVREIREELGFDVEAQELIGAYLGKGLWLNRVFILTYRTKLISKPGSFETQGEFGPASFKAFATTDLPANLAPVYREAIAKAVHNFQA